MPREARDFQATYDTEPIQVVGGRSLPMICPAVHSTTIDSCNYYDDYPKDIQCLELAVAHWDEGFPPAKAWEDALLSLIKVTIAEAKATAETLAARSA